MRGRVHRGLALEELKIKSEREIHINRIVIPCTSVPNSTMLRLLQKGRKHPY